MLNEVVCRGGSHRLASLLLGATVLSGLPAHAAPLDPLAYTSLGTLTVTSGSITIDTSTNTLSVSGGPTFTGVTQTQSGGPSITVFDFSSVSVASGVSVSFTGANPLAILSQGNMTFGGNLTVTAGTLGGGAGGNALSASGSGPGGGGQYLGAGAGGGYGGAGSTNVSGAGGIVYGDLNTILQGGSGGGRGMENPLVPGGAGGGGLELIAIGSLSVAGSVTASGSNGASPVTLDRFAGGGGSGGSIILGGSTVSVGVFLRAPGGSGGPYARSGSNGVGGGGGGGGRILIAPASFTLGTSIAPSILTRGGGGGDANGISPTRGADGQDGVVEIKPTTLLINPTGNTLALADGITTSGTLTVAYGGKSLENRGTVTQASGATTTLDTLTNIAGATVTLSGGSLNAGSIINTGAVTQAGATTNVTTFTNQTGGTATFNGGSVTAGQFDNSGTVTNAGAMAIIATGSNNAGGSLSLTGGSLTATTFSNAGSIELNGGTFNYTTFNQTGGVVSGSLTTATKTSAFLSGGTVGVTTIDNSGAVTNSGAATTATNLINSAGASFTLTGGTVSVTSVNNAGAFNLSGGTFTYTTFDQSAGTVTGTLSVDSGQTFTYTGGTFAGRLTDNGGSLNLSNVFTAGNGVENNADLTLAVGKTITSNGQGLENNAIVTLAGGTLNGNGALTNNAIITGFGTIGGSGGFTNNLGVTVAGGNLTLSNTGTNTNAHQIDLSSGRLLTLSGATLDNQGGLALAGGGVSGTGILRNQAGGVVSGKGSITANFANEAGGVVMLSDAGTTTISKAFSNAGVIQLTSASANLTGGKITSTGLIYGRGNVGNAIDNSGALRAEGGTLQLNGAVNNLAGGTVESGTGTTVLLSQGLTGNAGDNVVTGGRVDTNGNALINTGRIMGQGILATGGLTNNGQLSLGNGTSSVLGAVTNNQTTLIDNATVSFLGAVTNAAGATMTINHSTVSYLGGFTNSGNLVTDPTTLTFTTMTNAHPAAIVADPGDVFRIQQDLLGDTASNTNWDTDQATLAFVDGGTDLHRVELYGIDKGTARSGLLDNFAWGALTLEAGQMLTLADIKADGFNGALYIGSLDLQGYSGGSLAAFVLGAFDGNGYNIYYDPLAAGNSYLGGLTYSLGDGGSLIALQATAAPEPGTLGVLLAGLPALAAVRRRGRHPASM